MPHFVLGKIFDFMTSIFQRLYQLKTTNTPNQTLLKQQYLMTPSSAMECAITDPIIAIWFYYGAPSVFTLFKDKSIT